MCSFPPPWSRGYHWNIYVGLFLIIFDIAISDYVKLDYRASALPQVSHSAENVAVKTT